MKYYLATVALISALNLSADDMAPANVGSDTPLAYSGSSQGEMISNHEDVLKKNQTLRLSVIGQGISPLNTKSPAQAYALEKRAAIADAYRLIAEKVVGVRVDGQDLIKNMMVKRSTVRTSVQAMVKNSNIVETNFKDGLCEVEMEILISHSQFVQ